MPGICVSDNTDGTGRWMFYIFRLTAYFCITVKTQHIINHLVLLRIYDRGRRLLQRLQLAISKHTLKYAQIYTDTISLKQLCNAGPPLCGCNVIYDNYKFLS